MTTSTASPPTKKGSSLFTKKGGRRSTAARQNLFGWLFVGPFGIVFLAELGDKTQLATMTLSAAHRAPWTLFAASALALVVASAAAVLAGGLVARWVSPVWLARVAGTVLIVLGAWTLWRAGGGG